MAEQGLLLVQVRRLHAQAVEANNANHPSAALRALNRAERMLAGVSSADVSRLQCRLTITRAMTESELHGIAVALTLLDEAERAAEALADNALLALAISQRAAVCVRGGQLERGFGELSRALSVDPTIAGLDACNLLITSGSSAMMLGRLAIARDGLSRALNIAVEQGYLLERYKALHNLGYLDFLAGDTPTALRRMNEALLLGSDLPRGIPLLDRARVLAEAGLAREADESLAEAADTFARDRLSQDLAETELSRAECALRLEEPDAARRLARRARARFRRRGNVRWQRSAELVALQADQMLGRRGLSRKASELAIVLSADGQRNDARTAALVAAEALLTEGREIEAQAMFDRVGTHRAADPISVRMHARLVQARLATGPAAGRAVRTGLRELADYQARFGSIDLQTASAVHGRRLAELDLALALGTGRPHRMFDAAERGRAVSSRLPTVHPPLDEQTAVLLSELRRAVETLRAVDRNQPHAAPLRQRRRELEKAIAARAWTVAGSGTADRVVRFSQLREKLAEEDTSMSYYLRIGDSMHALAVGQGASRLVTLGPAQRVDEHIRRVRADLDALSGSRLPAPLRTSAANSLQRSLTALDDILLRPLGLSDGRLLIVPTGALGALPWTLLPSRRGIPLVVTPSATAWCRITQGNGSRLSALGGPDLLRADGEVATIGAAWPGPAIANATCGDLIKAMATNDIVHVAAHGRHQTENPLFSSLRMADGPLFAHELDQAAAHVVLSACDLGLATIRPGDEALGLTSVLLHLGSRSVVAGVARVEDGVAHDAMVRYHRGLRSGRDSARALAEALSGSPLDQPAPFVCFGSAWSAAVD